jgi:hypothetical protein
MKIAVVEAPYCGLSTEEHPVGRTVFVFIIFGNLGKCCVFFKWTMERIVSGIYSSVPVVFALILIATFLLRTA